MGTLLAAPEKDEMVEQFAANLAYLDGVLNEWVLARALGALRVDTVRTWQAGGRPRANMVYCRAWLAAAVLRVVAEGNGAHVPLAWMRSSNPYLSDDSPATLIRSATDLPTFQEVSRRLEEAVTGFCD